MGVLSIGDDVLGEVSALAAEAKVPVETEAEILLKEAIARRRDRLELVRRLDRIAALTPNPSDQIDSTLLVREDRNR